MTTAIDTNSLTLNGVEYVRKDSIPAPALPLGDVRIIIADLSTLRFSIRKLKP